MPRYHVLTDSFDEPSGRKNFNIATLDVPFSDSVLDVIVKLAGDECQFKRIDGVWHLNTTLPSEVVLCDQPKQGRRPNK